MQKHEILDHDSARPGIVQKPCFATMLKARRFRFAPCDMSMWSRMPLISAKFGSQNIVGTNFANIIAVWDFLAHFPKRSREATFWSHPFHQWQHHTRWPLDPQIYLIMFMLWLTDMITTCLLWDTYAHSTNFQDAQEPNRHQNRCSGSRNRSCQNLFSGAESQTRIVPQVLSVKTAPTFFWVFFFWGGGDCQLFLFKQFLVFALFPNDFRCSARKENKSYCCLLWLS